LNWSGFKKSKKKKKKKKRDEKIMLMGKKWIILAFQPQIGKKICVLSSFFLNTNTDTHVLTVHTQTAKRK
jgi:membrane protein YqaA with SNARE-associated domain